MTPEKKRTHTEVRWSVEPDETTDGHLTQVTLRRYTTITPVMSDGRRQWTQSKETVDTFGPFPASQIPSLIGELTETMLHYASGDRARDRVLEAQS